MLDDNFFELETHPGIGYENGLNTPLYHNEYGLSQCGTYPELVSIIRKANLNGLRVLARYLETFGYNLLWINDSYPSTKIAVATNKQLENKQYEIISTYENCQMDGYGVKGAYLKAAILTYKVYVEAIEGFPEYLKWKKTLPKEKQIYNYMRYCIPNTFNGRLRKKYGFDETWVCVEDGKFKKKWYDDMRLD